jgi:hypothetical protein
MTDEIKITLEYTHFGKIGDAMIAALDDECNRTANAVHNTADQLMASSPASGRIYKHGKVIHHASAPGEPPSPDTSALRGSGYSKRTGQAQYEVGYTALYAAALEFGAVKEKGSILPRPFLRPAVEKLRAGFIDACRKIVGAR